MNFKISKETIANKNEYAKEIIKAHLSGSRKSQLNPEIIGIWKRKMGQRLTGA
jgi:hypothetical protein